MAAPFSCRVWRTVATLYFSSERTTRVTYPRSLAQAEKDLQRMQAWDNGQYNIWQVPLAAIEHLQGP